MEGCGRLSPCWIKFSGFGFPVRVVIAVPSWLLMVVGIGPVLSMSFCFLLPVASVVALFGSGVVGVGRGRVGLFSFPVVLFALPVGIIAMGALAVPAV